MNVKFKKMMSLGDRIAAGSPLQMALAERNPTNWLSDVRCALA